MAGIVDVFAHGLECFNQGRPGNLERHGFRSVVHGVVNVVVAGEVIRCSGVDS